MTQKRLQALLADAAGVPIPHDSKGEAIYAYVILNEDVAWTEDLRTSLHNLVRKDIGALANPEYIQFVENMPKTYSAKAIRRILRKIAGAIMTTLVIPRHLQAMMCCRQLLLLIKR